MHAVWAPLPHAQPQNSQRGAQIHAVERTVGELGEAGEVRQGACGAATPKWEARERLKPSHTSDSEEGDSRLALLQLHAGGWAKDAS